jgi:hypothetical protein
LFRFGDGAQRGGLGENDHGKHGEQRRRKPGRVVFPPDSAPFSKVILPFPACMLVDIKHGERGWQRAAASLFALRNRREIVNAANGTMNGQ